MSFQSTVNYDFGAGMPGEAARNSPLRSHPGVIDSGGNPTRNVFGRGFTQPAAGGTVAPGGTDVFFGFLANPKQHASFGGSGGPLSPSYALPDDTVADFVYGGILWLAITNAASIGQQLQMAQADGQLSIPASPGTPDANHTLVPAWVTDFPQTNSGGGLVMARIWE